MASLSIHLARFMLRDFQEADRQAFVSYQSDPRYRALHDLESDDADGVHDLFDRFVAWQAADPRTHFQFGIFERGTNAICGSVGLRDVVDGTAELGIELAPERWGHFALALDVTAAMLGFGFDTLNLQTIMGSTASGNARVEKLARWFGARIVATREGPAWMAARDWREVDWAVDRVAFRDAPHRRERSLQ